MKVAGTNRIVKVWFESDLIAHRVRIPSRFHQTIQGDKMADVSIRPKPNGPYLIEGPADIYDTAGNKIATDDRPKIALCRCGASSNKPFCDGTHSKIGFQAAETINPESAEP
jgi:3-phenylpropionate/trans-cinnamate dioxygenase ferredoxin subunit